MNTSDENLARAWGLPIVLVILSLWFWQSWLVFPFKLLTVFFHELSHGIAAVITGGSIERIELNMNEGGVCYTRGGWFPLILLAGYLGSLLWGTVLLITAARTRYDREIVGGLGVLVLGVTLVYIRNASGFAFGALFGVGLLALAKYSSEWVCDQFLKYLGLTSSLYVVFDIKSDLIDRNVPMSDAYRLAEMVWLPGWVVGILWLALAVVILWKAMGVALKHAETESSTLPFPSPVSRKEIEP